MSANGDLPLDPAIPDVDLLSLEGETALGRDPFAEQVEIDPFLERLEELGGLQSPAAAQLRAPAPISDAKRLRHRWSIAADSSMPSTRPSPTRSISLARACPPPNPTSRALCPGSSCSASTAWFMIRALVLSSIRAKSSLPNIPDGLRAWAAMNLARPTTTSLPSGSMPRPIQTTRT